ncbi:protein of unknown function [Hyphomicrobium sp. MC1]|nr:protein of unknown function [Hyphomicrobium sp. MC1]
MRSREPTSGDILVRPKEPDATVKLSNRAENAPGEGRSSTHGMNAFAIASRKAEKLSR